MYKVKNLHLNVNKMVHVTLDVITAYEKVVALVIKSERLQKFTENDLVPFSDYKQYTAQLSSSC